MAADIANDIGYYLQLDLQHKDFLSHIRHWENLKVGIGEGSIWVKNITPEQLETVTLKSIPFAQLYFAKGNLLFPIGSLLPAGKAPAFLWTPIDRALPVSIERFNHNLFEIPGKIRVTLVPSDHEQKANALLTDFETADTYLQTAPAFRLMPLRWTIFDKVNVFIIGQPLLPLNGKAYWQRGNFMYPVGLEPEFSIIENMAARAIDASGENLIWWKDAKQYSLVPMTALQPLSIASWRKTMEKFLHKKLP